MKDKIKTRNKEKVIKKKVELPKQPLYPLISCFYHFRNSNSDTGLLDAISQKGLLHFPAERHRNKTPRWL